MIFFLSVYSLVGILWYFITISIYGFGAVWGGSKNSIPNFVLKTFYDWVYPKEGVNVKILIGVPVWIILWPISLTATLLVNNLKISN
jgi:hypothetical protein